MFTVNLSLKKNDGSPTIICDTKLVLKGSRKLIMIIIEEENYGPTIYKSEKICWMRSRMDSSRIPSRFAEIFGEAAKLFKSIIYSNKSDCSNLCKVVSFFWCVHGNLICFRVNWLHKNGGRRLEDSFLPGFKFPTAGDREKCFT